MKYIRNNEIRKENPFKYEARAGYIFKENTYTHKETKITISNNDLVQIMTFLSNSKINEVYPRNIRDKHVNMIIELRDSIINISLSFNDNEIVIFVEYMNYKFHYYLYDAEGSPIRDFLNKYL